MKLHRVAQGSLDWYKVRLGIPTASKFDKIVTPQGKISAQADKYLYRLVAERLLRETMDDQLGAVQWMERGLELEPDAANQFAFVNNVELEDGGFVTSDDGKLGCSPDRLVKGSRQSVEIKCPAPWTQIQYLLEGQGEAYRAQVQGQLLIGEFECVHFYSYHPKMPPVHVQNYPDHLFLASLRSALGRFLDVLEQKTERARVLGAYVVAEPQLPIDKAYPEAEKDPLTIVVPE